MITDTIIDAPGWEHVGLEALAEDAALATLGHMGLDGDYEISVLGCDDDRIAALNVQFRGKASPTNVLSWPFIDLSSDSPGGTPEPPDADELGDIAIAYDTCVREAAAQGKDLRAHVTHLIVHAVLHLLGYDHERDADATLMERLEVEILGNLGVSNPYS